jgi:hypothetical protein
MTIEQIALDTNGLHTSDQENTFAVTKENAFAQGAPVVCI